jgi:hypothetical protein
MGGRQEFNYVDQQTPIMESWERDVNATKSKARQSRVDADMKTARINSTAGVTDARSAFAAGKSSSVKKRFKAKRDGVFGGLGRLEKANMDVATTANKEAAEAESNAEAESSSFERERSKREAQDAVNQSSTVTVGAPIKLW